MVKNCGFSPQTPKDCVSDKTAKMTLIHCTIPMIIQDIC